MTTTNGHPKEIQTTFSLLVDFTEHPDDWSDLQVRPIGDIVSVAPNEKRWAQDPDYIFCRPTAAVCIGKYQIIDRKVGSRIINDGEAEEQWATYQLIRVDTEGESNAIE